jgi:hypothetical protein
MSWWLSQARCNRFDGVRGRHDDPCVQEARRLRVTHLPSGLALGFRHWPQSRSQTVGVSLRGHRSRAFVHSRETEHARARGPRSSWASSGLTHSTSTVLRRTSLNDAMHVIVAAIHRRVGIHRMS